MKTRSILLLTFLLTVSCTKSEITGTGQGNENQPGTEQDLPEGVVVAENVKEITVRESGLIVSVDEANETLVYSKDTPADILPEKGEILLSFFPTDELPYGFLGRVSEISETDAGYLVETEDVALEDAFEKFSINTVLPLVKAGTRASISEENGFKIIKEPVNFSAENEGCNMSLSGKFIFGSNITRISSDLDNDDNGGFMLDLETMIGVEDFSLSVSGTLSKDNEPSAKILEIPLTSPASVAIKTDLVVYFTLSGEAEFAFGAETSLVSADRFTVVSDGTKTSGSHSHLSGESVFGAPMPSISIKGETGVYITVAVEAKLFGRKNLECGVKASAGPKLEGKLAVDFQTADYGKLKDTKIDATMLNIKSEVYARMKLFNRFDAELSFEVLPETSIWERELFLFPAFTGQTVRDENGITTAEVKLSRDLLFPAGTGIVQYSGDDIIELYTPDEYYRNDEYANPLDAEFDSVQGQRLWTYVQWGDSYVKCEEISRPSIVGTWICTGYYWDGGVDYESDHVLIFNEDGTGASADIDSYKHPTNDQLIEYEYDYDTSTLKWRYTHPVEPWETQKVELDGDILTYHLYEQGHEWWIYRRL